MLIQSQKKQEQNILIKKEYIRRFQPLHASLPVTKMFFTLFLRFYPHIHKKFVKSFFTL